MDTLELLSVAGLTISVSQPRFSDGALRFVTQGTNADLRLDIRVEPPGHESKGDLLFDSGALWQLRRFGERSRFEFRSPLFGDAMYKYAEIDRDYASGVVVVDPRVDRKGIDPLEYPLDELLFMTLLTRRGGVEIHACGVEHDGRGYLFVGHSGAGKSTTAHLWMNAQPASHVLSDDRIAVRRDGDGFVFWGTPWHGEAKLAEPRRVAAARIFVLVEHAEQNYVRRMAASEAVAELLSRCFIPVWDAELMTLAADFLADLVENVEVLALGFRKDHRLADFILSC